MISKQFKFLNKIDLLFRFSCIKTSKIKINFVLIILIVFNLLFLFNPAFSISNDSTSKKSILIGEDSLKQLKLIEQKNNDLDSSYFTKEQNERYFRSLKYRIPNSVLLSNDFDRFYDKWKLYLELIKGNPWEVAMKNAQVPPQYYLPLGPEQVRYDINLINSQFIPGFRPLNLHGGLASLTSIGTFLGLVEDVSPVIKFKLEYADSVEIVIYSVQAVVVTTLIHKILPAGNYSFTWNLRDFNGKKMPVGDYVAEVRIGRTRYVRKVIRID